MAPHERAYDERLACCVTLQVSQKQALASNIRLVSARPRNDLSASYLLRLTILFNQRGRSRASCLARYYQTFQLHYRCKVNKKVGMTVSMQLLVLWS